MFKALFSLDFYSKGVRIYKGFVASFRFKFNLDFNLDSKLDTLNFIKTSFIILVNLINLADLINLANLTNLTKLDSNLIFILEDRCVARGVLLYL